MLDSVYEIRQFLFYFLVEIPFAHRKIELAVIIKPDLVIEGIDDHHKQHDIVIGILPACRTHFVKILSEL